VFAASLSLTAPTPFALFVGAASSLASYFVPWTSVSVTTFAPPFQTISLGFSVGTVKYLCTGENCTPYDYENTYVNFIRFWYLQINNGGFAPYPNVPVASSDAGTAATCFVAIGSAFLCQRAGPRAPPPPPRPPRC
jgi:hypothetical protein